MSAPAPIGTTLPRLLRGNAERAPQRTAMREKDRGIWQPYSWRRYWEETRDFALGLAAAGFARGDKLSVIGENRPRLYWAQLAAQCLGGIAVPVYQDAIASELAYVLDHAETSVVVAEDQEQVDKVLSLKARLPHLRLIVYDDSRGLHDSSSPLVRSFEAVQAAGRDFGKTHPLYVETEIDKAAPDDVTLFSYTSGTTSAPKGTMLSHANLLFSASSMLAAEDVRPTDEWLAYLPMAWIGNSLFSIALHLLVGFTCNYPERPESLQRDARELGPTAALAPPRYWENLLTAITVRAADASRMKRLCFDFFRRLAERGERLKASGGTLPPWLRAGLRLGEFLVYRPVRDQLGLSRARWAYTGGAALGADTFRFFRGFGVNLKQIYGATELAGLCALQPDHAAHPDTVGPVLPGCEVMTTPEGEVLIRCAGVFKGYYKQPEATRDAITAEGWLKTGDAGFVDQHGHLVIIDRAKDVGKLADGTVLAPQFLENKLKFSPYIGEAVVFGDRRPFVAAMIAIDPATVGNWAERRQIPYTSFQDLSARPEVHDLIRGEIERCNAVLPPATRIRRFVVLNKEFDADDDEITRTRKIRRRFVGEKYAAVIEGLYGGRGEVALSAAITYEDGRKATLQSTLAIVAVEPPAEAQTEPAYA
jgi:long-chain acyl-CoA synthetase